MRTKLVKRHFCDFCNKGGMVAASMIEHEKTCLRNPDRECFLCQEGRQKPAPMKELVDALFYGSRLEKVRSIASGCPACILATILNAKKDPRWDEEGYEYFAFDYKTEKDEWHAAQREPLGF